MRQELINAIQLPIHEEYVKEQWWLVGQLELIGEKKLTELIQSAISAREKAYKPYSEYPVGASVLCESGEIYTSPNTEVVTYTQTGHAEHNSINKAISEGEGQETRKFIKALVVCHDGDSQPCGACRQEILEHCDNAVVISVNPEGQLQSITSAKLLLPNAFTPKHLGIE